MPVSLDEFPIHQAPLSMRYVATSDRNAYDRCYFNAHDRTGNLFLVTGLGVYPNLGVIDAYATLRQGKYQYTLRVSDALGDDRMRQAVGPYRVEVQEPLGRIRLVCEPHDGSHLAFDLVFEASYSAVDEPPHVMRQGPKIILEAQRFAQVGTWSGWLELNGERITASDDTWVGTRDRSWGIRPVGEPEPPGRLASEPDPAFGFWWTYVPLRFDDFAIVVIAQEDGEGHRTLNEAIRVWPEASGRGVEQLGWPKVQIKYRSGTRHPEAALITMEDASGEPVEVEIDAIGFVALNCGPGYGGDPDWSHGQWKGRGYSETVTFDMEDPAIASRVPFGVVDHVARARCQGSEGWGMFEHGTFGRHTPSGFEDWASVAS